MFSRDNVAVFCLSVDIIKITTNYFRLGIIYINKVTHLSVYRIIIHYSLVITFKSFTFFENIIFILSYIMGKNYVLHFFYCCHSK